MYSSLLLLQTTPLPANGATHYVENLCITKNNTQNFREKKSISD